MSTPITSLKKHKNPYINICDYSALKEFEQLHPELYQSAPAPKQKSVFMDMSVQANAFNAIFNNEKYKNELIQLIQKYKDS
jgi:hypothetical protein